ncbi:MAG: ATPase [Oscillospiraceae bacterium]|nr:ATPase [Oscillospiraceae bacterium]
MSEENTVSSEELIDELYEMLEKAWSLPLSHGRAVVDGDEVRQILEELRESLPQEIRKARSIVADRNKIMEDSKKEADSIVRSAEERAKVMLNQQTILRQAQKQADDLIATTQKQTREMRHASGEYVDDLMRRADEGLTETLTSLRTARQSIHAAAAHAGKRKR